MRLIQRGVSVALLLALTLSVTAFGPLGLAASSDDADPITGADLASVRQPPGPAIKAAAHIVVDEQSGATLFASSEHSRLPIASTTKVMTALIVVEKAKLDDVVTVQVDASKLGDSSVMGLVPGEKMTVRDLLIGVLLPSGADAAIALAQHVAGSEQAFVDLMNRRAVELGLTDTHFANVHGLDAPNHYSSAADLAALTRVALRNSIIGEIVATRSATVRGAKLVYQPRNTNPLLGRPGVEGVKTGQTDAAGPCLILAVRRDGHRVIVVVLNSPDRADEAWRLADAAFSMYTWPTYTVPPDSFTGQSATPVKLDRALSVMPIWKQRRLDAYVLGDSRVELRLGAEVIATGTVGTQ